MINPNNGIARARVSRRLPKTKNPLRTIFRAIRDFYMVPFAARLHPKSTTRP